MQFNEAVSTLTLGGVRLRRDGQNVAATLEASGDRRTLTFKLVQPLLANTTYVLSVADVEDLSGNALTPSRTITFTTGSGADFEENTHAQTVACHRCRRRRGRLWPESRRGCKAHASEARRERTRATH